MDNTSLNRYLLIRSFGYGVYMAEIVPPEFGLMEKSRFRDGDRTRMTEELQRRIRESGLLSIQEILPDPDDPERAYLILDYGQEPCKIEIEQMEEYEMNLDIVMETHPSSRLGNRLKMLKEAAGH